MSGASSCCCGDDGKEGGNVQTADVAKGFNVINMTTDELDTERSEAWKPPFFEVDDVALVRRGLAFLWSCRLLERICAGCFRTGMAQEAWRRIGS